jgi:hypothetical protein
MLSSKIDSRSRRLIAVARRDDALLARAARRADWAGTALNTAAGDLSNAHSDDGNPLTGLTEVVREQAGRVRHLAADIESHRTPTSEDG